MRLVIDNYGSFIGKTGNRIVVKTKEKTEEFAANQVSQILISKGASFSSDLIHLATENDIDIVLLNYRGTPYARIYPCKLGGTTLTRRKQLEAYDSQKGANIAKAMIIAKLSNQRSFLSSLQKTRKNFDAKEECKYISFFIDKVDKLNGKIDEVREKLLGYEGTATKYYFQAFSRLMPPAFAFEGRNTQPPTDKINAMLSYSYGMLYSEAEKACILAGLDPYLGFIHTDRYGKPSMVLDLVEQFRQSIADRTVLTLITQKQMKEKDFEKIDNAVLLNDAGRQKTIEAVIQRLEQETNYRGKKAKLEDVVIGEARRITKYLLGEESGYKPFIYQW